MEDSVVFQGVLAINHEDRTNGDGNTPSNTKPSRLAGCGRPRHRATGNSEKLKNET